MFVFNLKKRTKRFWASVDRTRGPDACWPWTRSKCNKWGHGQVWWRGKNTTSHRIAWRLKRGKIPKGLCVLHECDNPPCCNPKHLFLGTKADNNEDKKKKGRSNRGERNGSAKLCDEEIMEIRRLRRKGWTCPRLARRFNISETHAESIVKRRTWKHLP